MLTDCTLSLPDITHDESLAEADILRTVRLDRWTVCTIATPHCDQRGQTGIRVVIWDAEHAALDCQED